MALPATAGSDWTLFSLLSSEYTETESGSDLPGPVDLPAKRKKKALRNVAFIPREWERKVEDKLKRIVMSEWMKDCVRACVRASGREGEREVQLTCF